MPELKKNRLLKIFSPFFFWCMAAVYTFVLPEAIILYTYIRENFGNVTAGRVPAVFVILFGIGYVGYLVFQKKNLKNLLFIIPCAIIVLIIFNVETNPNKHIHIPEYAILSWLVYAALGSKYEGKGIYFLIFICTSMLGIVDELEQGIHPTRFFGLSDMLVNSSSALIGVFTILGLKKFNERDIDLSEEIKKLTGLWVLIIFGVISLVFMISSLFNVQAQGGVFEGVYPAGLLVCSILFLINTPLMIYLYRPLFRKHSPIADKRNSSAENSKAATIQLWILPIISILFYMHSLVVYARILGVNFR